MVYLAEQLTAVTVRTLSKCSRKQGSSWRKFATDQDEVAKNLILYRIKWLKCCGLLTADPRYKKIRVSVIQKVKTLFLWITHFAQLTKLNIQYWLLFSVDSRVVVVFICLKNISTRGLYCLQYKHDVVFSWALEIYHNNDNSQVIYNVNPCSQ